MDIFGAKWAWRKSAGVGVPATAAGVPYTEATFKTFQKQLQEHGKQSILKSRATIQRRLTEHLGKLDEIKKASGYTSSIEREIRIFRSQLEAIDNLLK